MRYSWQRLLVALLLITGTGVAGSPRVADAQIMPLPAIDEKLRADFPAVASIKAADLQKLINEKKRPVILDVRDAKEFAVSHVQNAIHIAPDAKLGDVLQAIGPDLQGRSVIVYCSVGIRSTQLADRLQAGLKSHGAGQVANLSEGLFGWHNAGLPLQQGAEETSYIHPYNSLWGQLVRRQDLIAYQPVAAGLTPLKTSGVNEMLVRLGAFLGVFILLAAAETFYPRRLRTLPRRTRWQSHFGMLALATVLVRLVAIFFPLVGAAVAALYAAQHGLGLFHWLNLPDWIEIALAVVLFDLAIWAQHVVTHHVPILWRLHMVHHADRDLDASSALRFHPIEILLSALYKLVVILCLGPTVIAVIAFEILLNAAAMFNHANWALPEKLDRILRQAIVTPDMHRIHHSVLLKEHHRNFGFCLSIWDRLFGTYKAAPDAGQDGMTIGLARWQKDGQPAQLSWLLRLPFIRQST